MRSLAALAAATSALAALVVLVAALLPEPPTLRGRWAEAEVTVDGTPCPRDGGDRVCGAAPWMRVGPQLPSVGWRTFPCVFAHPQGGRALQLQLRNFPSSGPLVLEAGLVDGAALGGRGAPVAIEAWLDDRPAGVLRVPDRTGRFELRLAQPAAPTATLRLLVTTPEDGRRQLCLDVHPE